jgi:hypothetical protein
MTEVMIEVTSIDKGEVPGSNPGRLALAGRRLAWRFSLRGSNPGRSALAPTGSSTVRAP